jgi:hypothetical protein
MSKKFIYLIFYVLVLGLVLTGVAKAADPDLVGCWRFDEGSGTTAFDSSGNGNDGTLVGDALWVPGKFGGALEFNGSNARVDAPYIPLDSRSFTITMWVNPVLYTSEQLVFSQVESNTTNLSLHFRIYGPGSGRVRMGFYSNDLDTTGNTIEENNWYHLAFWYDFENQNRRIYVNGVLEAEASATPYLGTSGNTVIGSWGTSQWFQGIIDDVRIYSRALSDAEILGVMSGGGAEYPFASAPDPADGVYHLDTWVNLSWRTGDFAVSHDVYFGENFNDVNDGTGDTSKGNQAETFFVVGFPGFLYPDGLVPGTTYYWRIDEVNDTEPWKGDVWSFTVPPKTAYLPDPADAAELVEPDARISWTAGFGAKLHTVYFGENFDDVSSATGGLPQGGTTYTPGTLKLAQTYYWRVDEFDAIETHKGDVWSFTTEGAVGNPNPANGAVDVKQTQIITWSPSVFAASHEVYFGTDGDAVKNADTGSPEYQGTRDLGAESYDPGMLEWDSTYYWRIDEVNNTNPDSPWPGILWSFTTANFLIVDDFESYNDLDPADPESNRIFNVWIDGYDDPANGSLVGYEAPPFAEQTIVHGGNQSLPLYYDNSVGYSEATLTLTYPRDWTEKGVNTLTIWFRGDSANAAEVLYVALNGNAIVTNDNPDAAQIEEWTRWNIDLQAFGVNLVDVNTISLGLGNKNNPVAGGSGTMYYDDIRLYPPAP